MRILLISPTFPPDLCGVGDHSAMLGGALSAAGHTVHALVASPGPRPASAGLAGVQRFGRLEQLVPLARRAIAGLRPDVLLLQYAPYGYSRLGLEPHIVRLCSCLRGQTRIVPFCHELYQEWTGGTRTRVLSVLQALQFGAVCRLADGAIVTSEERVAPTRRALRPGRPLTLVPIGSNLGEPDRRAGDRLWARHRLEGQTVLTTFGRPHPSRNEAWLADLADRLTDRQRLLVIGPLDAERLRLFGGRPRAVLTDRLPAATAAAALERSAVVLAPFSDGASTRRGSLIAPLVLGSPVLSVRGKNTGPLLREYRGLVLTAPDPVAYAGAVDRLLSDPGRLEQLREQARHNRAQFGWPRLARMVSQFLQRIGSRR